MEPATLIIALISFILLLEQFPSALAQSHEKAADFQGVPLVAGTEYYILPSHLGIEGGGVRLDKTGNQTCPLTIVQDYSVTIFGDTVKFSTPPGTGPDARLIFTGTPLDIEFTEKPGCATSSKWSVFEDDDYLMYLGVAGPGHVPTMKNGKFNIQRFEGAYKLGFCYSHVCYDVEKFDHGHEGGWRLGLVSVGEPFKLVFVNVKDVIKHVV